MTTPIRPPAPSHKEEALVVHPFCRIISIKLESKDEQEIYEEISIALDLRRKKEEEMRQEFLTQVRKKQFSHIMDGK